MNKNLLKLTSIAILGGGLMAASSVSLAGIVDTKHNLGTTAGNPGVNKFDGTAEICVFCHTPHGAKTDIAAPLWNKSVSDITAFQTYDSLGTVSLDGAVANIGSVSIACLSCHDGSQAMDTVINAPGSGGYNTSGASQTGAWTGANQSAGQLAAGIITNLGTDLRNDHPVSIQYGGGGVNVTTHATDGLFSGTLGDPDFKKPYRKTINTKPVWWVETGGGTTRNKTDMQLYTRDGATLAQGDGTGTFTGSAAGVQPFVECASCHDPHVSATNTFLRINNDGSAVCIACHDK